MNFKKRTNFLFGALLLTGSLLAQNVCVSTPKTSLVLSVPEGGTRCCSDSIVFPY